MRITHQLRTLKAYNLHLVDAADCIGGVWPAVMPTNTRPKRVTTFYPKTAKDNSDAFCHFFIDDYRFEKVWREPERYVPVLKKYAGAIMPNFSTYHIMPLPMQWWNMYRNRALMAYWQSEGIDVIPSLQIGDPRTYDYALDGLPVGGTYAVANNGLMKDKYNKEYFVESLAVALKAVMPDLLLIYGSAKFDLPYPCEVMWCKNDNTDRVRKAYALTAGDRGQMKLLSDGEIDAEEYLNDRMANATDGGGVERAVCNVPDDDYDPLMYNEDLAGWVPPYMIEGDKRLLGDGG